MRKIVTAKTAEDTEKLGRSIGQNLKGGDVIELISDLGGGKTTLTRGLVAGAGSKDLVSSPTFTISNVYTTDKLIIDHFDFYRLGEAGLVEHELQDVLGDLGHAVIVEWSDVVAHVLPEDRLTVRISPGEDDSREFKFECSDKLSYLIKKL